MMNKIPSQFHRYRLVSAGTAAIAIAVGTLVFIGWWLHIPALTSVVPGLVTMKPNTAACFLLAGLALWLQLFPNDAAKSRRLKKVVVRVCALALMVVGSLTLGERLFGWKVGIDELFFRQTLLATQVPRPGLMAAASALAFFLLGTALLLLDWETPRRRRPAQGVALAVVLIGFVALLGYLYGVQLLFGAAGYAAVAVNTGVVFLLLGIGVLLARPDRGLMAVLTSERLGGLMARRLLPFLVASPVLVGWLRVRGQHAGLYQPEFGSAFFGAGYVVILASVAWVCALWLNRADTARSRAEERDLLLAALVESASDAVVSTSPEGAITSWNKGAESLYGYNEEEVLGKQINLFSPADKQEEATHVLREIQEKQAVVRYETVRRRKDGSLLPVATTVFPLRDRSGALLGIASVSRDITAQKSFEQALSHSQAQLKGIIDSATDALITVDQEQRVVMFNPAAEKMFGYSSPEIVGAPLERLIPMRFRAEHGKHIHRFGTTGTTSRAMGALGALSGLRKNGTEFPIEASISQVEISGKKLFTAIVRDVTDRVRIEESLRQSQAQLKGIIDSAMDALITVDSRQQVVMFNPAAEKMFQCSAADALGSPLDRFIPERFRGTHGKHVQTFGETGVTSRTMGTLGALKGLRANGEEFPIEASISQTVSRGSKLYTAIVRDVTERERSDRALREQASVLELAQVMVRDMDDRIVLWNRGAEKLYGFTPAEAMGLTSHELLQTEFPEPVHAILDKLMATGEWEGEMVHRKRDGARIVVASVWTLERDSDGRPWRILEANTDITARKRAEEALRLAQARLLSALEGGRMGTWVWDIGNPRIDWDDSMSTLFGRSSEELASGSIEPFFSWLHPQDRERTRAILERAVREGTQYDAEYRLFRPDQSMVWIAARGRVERDAQGKAFRMTGVCIDITDRRKVEEQLLQSQKMQALGTLAGGIAHDFNNILLAIGGNVSLAMEDLPANHPAQTSLREIGKAGARATGLVRQILAFSRRQAPDRKSIDVKSVVEEALALLRATLPARIAIRANFGPDLPSISADSTQLHQVIMNLGTNAARAMGEQGGLLDVTAKAVTVNSDLAAQTKMKEGNYLRLSISDSGCGMDPLTLERIFEPFFTTHAPGEGTGLGLSVVHGIMKDHDGSVSVYSEPGKGTIFHLYLPAIRELAQNAPATVAPSGGHGQRLLYVDDEESLVFLATRSLGRLGYKVTGETDPARAVQLFRENPSQFDAVITDLSMPGLSGSELARQIMEVRPNTPVVMMSGYIRPEDEEEASRLGIRDVILKPDTIEDLAQALNRLFKANGAGPDTATD